MDSYQRYTLARERERALDRLQVELTASAPAIGRILDEHAPIDTCATHHVRSCPDGMCAALYSWAKLSESQRIAFIGIFASRNPDLFVDIAVTAIDRYPEH